MAAAGAALRQDGQRGPRPGRASDAPVAGPLARIAVFSVAGGDTPRDVRRLRAGFGRLGWPQRLIVVGDAYGPLRAGTDDGIGAVVICGSGSNMLAIGPTGRIAAYPGAR